MIVSVPDNCLSFYFDPLNYMDDFGSAEDPISADNAYMELVTLINRIDLRVAEEKCSPSSTKMIFLGKEFDSMNLAVSGGEGFRH